MKSGVFLEKNCDPEDPNDEDCGDVWDHVAFDSKHRLVVCVIPGKRTAENTQQIVKEFKKRTGGRTIRPITTHKYMPYLAAILNEYSDIITSVRAGKPGRPMKPRRIPKTGLNYAMVKKRLFKGRISTVETEIIFGTQEDVDAALKVSKASKKINTSFIERQNGTNRNQNSINVRKALFFLKDEKNMML